MTTPKRIVVGITGASGAAYAQRIIQQLAASGIEVHLALTPFGRRLLHDELGMEGIDLDAISGGRSEQIILHRDRDAGAAIGSGSFQHDGMVIVPCSSNTLGAIAHGITMNLVQRAAAVTLKERRPLIIAHREMPLSPIDIENMRHLSRAGAVIAPLSPGFYLLPRSVDDIIDFVAARLLDLLNVSHQISARWGENTA
ncbi:MAG: UbiX family flavin prenyltransferase [Phycisphaerales bacterium]